jgi:uncharacterized protein (TIGR00255 family)
VVAEPHALLGDIAPLGEHRRLLGDLGGGAGRDLRARATTIAGLLAKVEKRVPAVVKASHRKIRERVDELLGREAATGAAAEIAKEAALLAQRGDVTEECVRLRHHCEDLAIALKGTESSGRKIDFLAQEMLREANTIGSKSGDAPIARAVVAMKAEIDRIKEQAANLE